MWKCGIYRETMGIIGKQHIYIFTYVHCSGSDDLGRCSEYREKGKHIGNSWRNLPDTWCI
jgi:hypothetical protein